MFFCLKTSQIDPVINTYSSKQTTVAIIHKQMLTIHHYFSKV